MWKSHLQIAKNNPQNLWIKLLVKAQIPAAAGLV
jgi:hypothetical protein